MIPALKAEYRKLTSVRSTYFVTAAALVLMIALVGYIYGFRSDSAAGTDRLSQAVLTGVNLVSLFAALICVLQVAHEYRHNLILYTLTAANSRSKVFAAKIIVAAGYLAGFALLAGGLSALAAYVGAAFSGAPLGQQDVAVWNLIWRSVSAVGLYGLLGVVLTLLLRSVAPALAILLITPITVEPLLGLVLKSKAAYLPFSALQSLSATAGQGSLGARTALWVSALYVAAGLLVAWLLFVRRDAN